MISAACVRAANPPVPGVNLTVMTNFYSVFGSSIQDFKRHIAAFGPTDPDGTRRDARTDSRMTWDYEYVAANGGFYISTSVVSLDVKYTIPRLAAASAVPTVVAAEWSRYISALMVHEAGHSNVAAQAAQKLSRTLRQSKVFLAQKELADFVQVEGQKCLAESKSEDSAYDQRTRHGLTQGAVLHSR